ncbi:MAG: hypothetical protein QM791_03765 [Ferruginibacter sp.]
MPDQEKQYLFVHYNEILPYHHVYDLYRTKNSTGKTKGIIRQTYNYRNGA